MPPTPSPTPVDVLVHSGPAEWWQILAALGPLAVLLGAGIAGYFAWRGLRQKAAADNRAEWWKRTQWALDYVYSGDAKRGTAGLKVLQVLGESELAGPGELAVLEAAWKTSLGEAEKKLALRVNVEPEDDRYSERILEYLDAQVKGRDQPLQVFDQPGVDDEPDPRDNKEDDKPEGGA
ncbi:hypothetical protein IV500_05995 [Paeniglutamicibacter antarcticus]|uniref:Uncharacterized protein n=1 Tax=Arthrobacter terrae TaxID=2935737 RepID=A0A931G771_9MICC|nr:hypothetical protein [Arthrobacter terrae]MBG0738974.1 hypothetical protein [Arthrobacter terrae]